MADIESPPVDGSLVNCSLCRFSITCRILNSDKLKLNFSLENIANCFSAEKFSCSLKTWGDEASQPPLRIKDGVRQNQFHIESDLDTHASVYKCGHGNECN